MDLSFGTVPDGYQFELSSRNGRVQVSVSILQKLYPAGFTAITQERFLPVSRKFNDTSKGDRLLAGTLVTDDKR